MSELAEALESLIGQSFLITTTPEVLDFINPKALASLIIIAHGKKLEVPLSHNRTELIKVVGELKFYFNEAKVLLAWDIKNLFSFVLYVTGKDLSLSVPVIDLKILEAFLGHSEPCPTLFRDAKERLEKVLGNPSWPKLKIIYKTIHTPLVREIAPQIETLGLADTNQKLILHPYYEIEGQKNGRMRCINGYQRSFNPHTLDETDKEFLTTPDFDNKEFLYFDFKHMEVAVLQWLSKDKLLGNILTRGKDVYESIWESITGLPCSPSRRKVCKDFFLPVVFGMGTEAVAKRANVEGGVAKSIVSKIYKNFGTAMGWVGGKDVDNNIGIDYYGRHRLFEEEYYRPQLRNFHIQAPASIVCLHKLVKLHKIIQGMGRISFHVHDGYCVIPNKGQEINLLKICKETLESGDDFYPGLKLRVKSYRGTNLNKLKEIQCEQKKN